MSVRIRLARTADELDQVFRLRHLVYAEEESFMPRRPDRRIYDRFDAYPHTANIIAVVDDEVVGTARILEDDEIGSPAEEFYDFPSALPGLRRASGSMLCVRREHRNAEVVFSMMAMVYYWAAARGVTHVYSPVNPEQRPFFERSGYRAIDEEGFHPGKGLPYLPMVLDLDEIDDAFVRFVRRKKIEALMTAFERLFLRAGETLFQRGDRGDAAYVVAHGRVRVHIPRTGEPDIVVAELGPGDMIGEVALLADVRRTATVSALTDCDLMELDRATFEERCSDPELARAMLDLVGKRLASSLELLAQR